MTGEIGEVFEAYNKVALLVFIGYVCQTGRVAGDKTQRWQAETALVLFGGLFGGFVLGCFSF